MNKAPLLAFLAPLALAACAASPATGGQPATTLSGTVTGLTASRSDLTVAGRTVTLSANGTTATAVRVGSDAVTLNALSLGQRVTVQAAGDRASSVDILLEVKGTVATKGANSLVVAGQTVLVTAATRFDVSGDDDTRASTGRSFADVNVGNFVEVTGERGAGGITATLVEVKSLAERGEDGIDEDTHLAGTVANLDTVAKTFTLGALIVHYGSAEVDTEGTLQNGAAVRVEGILDVTGTVLTASEVEFDTGDDRAQPGASVVIEDDIDALNLTAKTFSAEHFTVDYSQATVSGTLAVDARVRVEGKVDGADASLLHATTVTVTRAPSEDD
jgi:hypothetical protein